MNAHPARWPWWLQVLTVHAVARLVAGIVLAGVATTQAATGWTDAAPSYPRYVGLMWDATWYRTIAEEGYPVGLPTGPDGAVLQSAWAFYPLFPWLVRPILGLGVPWHVAAPLLATALGGLALLVVHQVLAHAVGQPRAAGLAPGVRRWVPLTGVVLVSAAPAAPVLQVAYTESLALLLVASALWSLQRERYGLAVVPVVGLGLTRAVALPILVAVAAHALARARRADRTPGRWWAIAGLGSATLVSGLLWPVLVGLATGRADAFTATQGAWRGRGEVVPLLPWLDVSVWLGGAWGPVLLLVAVGAVVVGLLARPLRRLGPEAHGWTVGYLAYLLLAVEPGTSLVRFVLLAFPVAGALAQPLLGARRPPLAMAGALLLGLLGQVAWIVTVWRLVPPAGWPP